MNAFIAIAAAVTATGLMGETVNLPEVSVHSPRIANQTPASTFTMPVSALRYEAVVDIQARNLAEGQADVTIRGGIFENTGFRVGVLSIVDPQTGHYFAEIPISPAMLAAPRILTGAELAHGGLNATSGVVAQDWRSLRNAGATNVALGEHGFWRAEWYQGAVREVGAGGNRVGIDVSVAHSESDGAVRFGDHAFDRVNARVQFASARSQTDVFAGYQAKFFGWPNLYTPFNSAESENLQTTLFALNHRLDLGDGDFVAAGAYHRRNKDDYAFNRFAPVGPIHPFQHTTEVSGLSVEARRGVAGLHWNVRAEASRDEITSTSLTFGRFRSRDFVRISLIPEKAWTASGGIRTTFKAGAAFDDTNRDGSAVSPVVELARSWSSGRLRRVYASVSEHTQLPTYTALNSSATAGLFRGNPNLGRQTSRNVEIGGSAGGGGWAADAAVFFRRDEALVDWTFRRGVTARTANPVNVDVLGFEVVARRGWRNVDVVVSYTVLAKDADYRGAAVDASFYALNYARHRLTAALVARLGAGWEVRFDNAARIQEDNALRAVGGDETLLSTLALAYRPRAWRGFEISAQVENLWGSNFQEVPAVPASPRQASLAVAYAW
jgi:hypothetical protein